jgi:hypothetical protein
MANALDEDRRAGQADSSISADREPVKGEAAA